MRSFTTVCAVLLVCSTCLSACQEASEPGPGTVVSDSAGVTIVHHGGSTIDDVPLLTLEEVVRIGTLDGPEETQFFQIVDAVEADDEIYVLDRGNHEVRVFRSDGEFLRSFGGEGDGPGEFRRPMDLTVVGDTVSILGIRLTLLDLEGRPLATGPGRVFSDSGYFVSMLPTGKGWMGIWYTRNGVTVDRGAPFSETVTVYHVDPLTAKIGSPVFAYETGEARLAGEAGWKISPFFQATPTLTLGPDGTVYFTPGDSYLVNVIDGGNGRLVRRITGDLSLPPVTDELLDRALQAERDQVKDYPPGSEMAMYAEVIDQIAALPGPKTMPIFGWMYASESGWLLALRLDLDEDPVNTGNTSVWDLFAPDGELRGRVRLSPQHRVLSLTDDGLLAVLRDDMDVQSLVKYRFLLESIPES